MRRWLQMFLSISVPYENKLLSSLFWVINSNFSFKLIGHCEVDLQKWTQKIRFFDLSLTKPQAWCYLDLFSKILKMDEKNILTGLMGPWGKFVQHEERHLRGYEGLSETAYNIATYRTIGTILFDTFYSWSLCAKLGKKLPIYAWVIWLCQGKKESNDNRFHSFTKCFSHRQRITPLSLSALVSLSQASNMVKQYDRENLTVWATVDSTIMKKCRRSVSVN